MWILVILVALVLWAVLIYNGLIQLRVRADGAWSDIGVQLKRRYDLIPNIVEAVKGYAAHEQKVFLQVTEARSRCTFRYSAIRNLLWVIPLVNVVMGVTGLYYLSKDRAGRHWGDRLADTRVVKA